MAAEEFTRAPRAQPDAELIRSAVAGERAAVEAVLVFLRPLVLQYCFGRLGARESGPSGAEDCAQEILLAVLTELPGYQPDTGLFMPFVFGIADHRVTDVDRTRDHGPSEPLRNPDRVRFRALTGLEPDAFALTDGRLRLGELLALLPDLQRTVLTMRVILGFSAVETATALGMSSAGAVRVTQHRALARLRQVLGDGSTLAGDLN